MKSRIHIAMVLAVTVAAFAAPTVSKLEWRLTEVGLGRECPTSVPSRVKPLVETPQVGTGPVLPPGSGIR